MPFRLPRRRWRALAALAAAAVIVVGCGGGSSQHEPFEPQRLFAFGDETSFLAADGRRWGVNGLDTNGVFDCRLQPIWVQSVAAAYGYAFAECNPDDLPENATMHAAVGATVADVAAQVEAAQIAAGGFRSDDLALVLGGTNDVLAAYAQFPTRTEAELLDDVRDRGRAMALAVNRLVELGARVVVSNLPDLGVSPYAVAEKAAHADVDRAALLSRLTVAFNESLGVNLLLDGRFIGLAQTDLRTQAAQRSPGSVGLTNADTAVCTVALPDCTTATLIANATPTLYLWADATRLASGGHAILASLALDRARDNPF